MFDRIKKKIKNKINLFYSFFKLHLAEIVILVFVFQMLTSFKELPYFNIIENYEYYVLIFVILLAAIFFRVTISNRTFIKLILIIIIVSAIFLLIELYPVSTLLGFMIYVLTFLVVIRALNKNRKLIKEEDVH